MSSPILITLDGNIGAGKSTLLDMISEKLPYVTVIPEPVGDWLKMTNEKGESLLSLFYNDTSRWCYTFQNCALLTRLLHTEDIIKNWKPTENKSRIIITERSVLTDRFVFAEMLYKNGKMDKLEWELYLKWFNHYAAHLPVKGIIHLATGSKTSKERIGIRGRAGEESIQMSYLEDLEAQHNKWIAESHLPSLQITSEPGTDINKSIADIEAWLKVNYL